MHFVRSGGPELFLEYSRKFPNDIDLLNKALRTVAHCVRDEDQAFSLFNNTFIEALLLVFFPFPFSLPFPFPL